jgi:hypothetical protein
LKSMAADDCVAALISSWVARFRVPSILTSDQGRQFTSFLWAGLTKLLGIKHVQTTAYHPQSNGMVERTRGQLKAALRLAGSRWPEHLPRVLLGLRTALKEDCDISAAELVYGAALALPAEFLSAAEPPATDFLKTLQLVEMPATRPLSYAEAAANTPTAFLRATHVYVRPGGTLPPLSPLYVGPLQGVGESGQVFPPGGWRPRGDGQYRPVEAALGSGPFLSGPPCGMRPPPYLRSCGVPAAAACSSCDWRGALSRSGLVVNLGVCGQ